MERLVFSTIILSVHEKTQVGNRVLLYIHEKRNIPSCSHHHNGTDDCNGDIHYYF